MFEIGPRLAFLRTQRGLTQVKLSQRTGIPQANLSKIERGQQDPTVSTLLRICSALQVSPARVLQEEPERRMIRWTRASLERVARVVVGSEEALPQREREIVELLRDVLVGRRAGRLSSRRVYQSWYQLKRRLTEEEIKTLAERVQDAEQRQAAWPGTAQYSRRANRSVPGDPAADRRSTNRRPTGASAEQRLVGGSQ